jgi:hypothetical protein
MLKLRVLIIDLVGRSDQIVVELALITMTLELQVLELRVAVGVDEVIGQVILRETLDLLWSFGHTYLFNYKEA